MAELLITIAITGLIFGVAGGVIFQLSTASGAGNDRLTANHELQNAAYWFTRDGQSAQSATGGPSLSLTLPANQNVLYSLNGTNLLRIVGGNSITLAQNISRVIFVVQGRLVSMDLTSAPVGRANISVEQVYKVYLRTQ